jgi:hypothetical protein
MLINWVAALRPIEQKKGWYWGTDGRFRMLVYPQKSDTNWLHAPDHIPGSREAGLDCGVLTIFHENVCQGRGIHSFCLECYKVVVVLETLEQVHKMADWQATTGWACKTGAESRPEVCRNWGAYFYCRGKEEGRERYKAVREWVDENLGEDINVFLKRGCTEFEQRMGDSDKWKMFPRQEELEKEFLEVLDYDAPPLQQGEVIQHNVFDVWDKWARLTAKPVTYHEEEE